MNNSPPSSSSSGKSMSLPRKFALNAINEIHERSNDYLHTRTGGRGHSDGRKRAALAAVLSTVSAVGAEKLSHADIDEFQSLSEGDSRDKVHFMDKLTNKLIDTIPRRFDESMDELRHRLEDKHRIDQPGLSITRISKNFKTLSSKMDIFFKLEYSVLHIISWDQPPLTLTFLILYSWACLMPYLFLVYPVVYLLAGILIPNYLYRHPLEKPEIIPTRQLGDSSIFGFLRAKNDWEMDRQRLEMERRRRPEQLHSREYDLATISSRNSTDSEDEGNSSLLYDAFTADSKSNIVFKAVLEEEDAASPEKKSSSMADKVKLLINMRDLQNLTTSLIKMIENMEKNVYDNCSFKDEKTSTKLFLNLVVLIIITVALGPYIPWCAIFIITLWVLVLLKHPNRSEFLKQFQTNSRKQHIIRQSKPVQKASILSEIVVDDPPQYRKIQIYEIEKQDMIKTSVYEPYLFSPSIFNESDSSRLQKKRPKGTTNLGAVQPPGTNWKYTNSNWTVDEEVEAWCLENGVLDELEIKSSWAYDKSGEYRRRRLIREVVRTSRPPKKRTTA
ncbi:hypothetical protein KL906_001369 [Ogataea polymorpha]|nr:hypothetical protein KL906_001369 [Ogataea polymorpha]